MLRRLRIQGGGRNYTVTRGLTPAPRRAHKCALLMLAPWLGYGGVSSDVGSALGGVLYPALAPSQAPPLVRRTQDTPYAQTFATPWLSPTSLYSLPLAHHLALATPSGLQPLGESGSGLQPAVVFIRYAKTPQRALTIPAVMSERALLSWGD